jgi:formylglycine-generating enzyme required for sulfatase activity
MNRDRAKRLAQLRQAYESGILDEDTYQAAVTALSAEVGSRTAVESYGAVARDRSVTAGAGGVAVGGDVHGNIYVGPLPQNPAEALAIYRRVLVSTCRHLPLRGVDLGASDPTGGQQRLDLAQVYVDLDTKTQVPLAEEGRRQRELFDERDTRPLGVLEATTGNRRLVILGDPGSGKSTFLNHLALRLAAYGLAPEGSQSSEYRDWLAQLPGWPEEEANVLPISVVLRDFARWLPGDAERAEPRHLWDFIVSRLEAQNLAFAAEPLHRALEKGKAIVLLDGLDEIPTKTQRMFIRDAVVSFAGRYPESRLAIACRTLPYQESAWQLEGFPAFELAPFDEEKIDSFIQAWHNELARLGVVKAEEAGGLARRLQEAVRRPDLWRLAPNPLLLTVMALVHTHKGRLPDARAMLYEDTIDVLLWRWEQIKAGDEEAAPRLRRLLLEARRTDVDLKRALWRLAFQAHREGGAGDETLADIGELRLEKELAALHPEKSLDWAHQVIETMKLRAGLLLERAPEIYTFPHRTFQEYLAGAHLSAQADFARQAVQLVGEGAFWREVVVLAVGRLVYLSGDTDKPLALVGELCPQQAVDDEVAWRKAWLAGEVLVEMGVNRVKDSALGWDLVERVSHRLADLVREGRLSPVERAVTSDALARLGDPRPGVGLRPDGLPDIVWCEVPAGPFLMGSDKARDPQASDEELPKHEVTLPAYSIGKYPVTNAQYAAFVQEGGYRNDDWWEEAVGAGYWSPAGFRGVFDQEPRIGPATYSGVYDLPNHPVVGVSWYEAVAFCCWLTELLRKAGEIGSRQEVTLPTEAQWEKAARGGLLPPSEREGPRVRVRIFPWGDEFDKAKCNMADTGIGTTSAVGIFPAGASPYGVQDMSGNVWEWCRTKWRARYKRPADESLGEDVSRVVRGGAFNVDEWSVRCAYRDKLIPSNLWYDFGFRVVVAPAPLDL